MIRDGLGGPQSDFGARLPDVSPRMSGTGQMPSDALLSHADAQSAGNGGDGIFLGMAFDHAETNFSPFNMANSTLNASAAALQANSMRLEQAVVKLPGWVATEKMRTLPTTEALPSSLDKTSSRSETPRLRLGTAETVSLPAASSIHRSPCTTPSILPLRDRMPTQ